MQPWMWIAIGVAVAVVIALAVLWWLRRPSRQLQKKFGPEYDRAVEQLNDRQAAHDELQRRARRRESYELRSLTDAERDRYVRRWRTLQRHFTKQPATGLLEADELLVELLRDVGYPTDSFEQQAADLSVADAHVVSEYRDGHAVVIDVQHGRAGTEEIRRALLRYRDVFERVAETDVSETTREELS